MLNLRVAWAIPQPFFETGQFLFVYVLWFNDKTVAQARSKMKSWKKTTHWNHLILGCYQTVLDGYWCYRLQQSSDHNLATALSVEALNWVHSFSTFPISKSIKLPRCWSVHSSAPFFTGVSRAFSHRSEGTSDVGQSPTIGLIRSGTSYFMFEHFVHYGQSMASTHVQ